MDELKYHHNQKMEKRLTAKVHGLFIFATLLTFLIMLLSPGRLVEHKITFENYSGAVAVAVFCPIWEAGRPLSPSRGLCALCRRVR